MTTFDIGIAGVPYREGPVAQICVTHRDPPSVDIPAEVYREDGKLMIELFPRRGEDSWELPLPDFLEAIGKAMSVLHA